MKNVRKVRRADIIRTREGDEEVVRNVSVVLHLSNGASVSYDSNEEVEIIPQEPEVDSE